VDGLNAFRKRKAMGLAVESYIVSFYNSVVLVVNICFSFLLLF